MNGMQLTAQLGLSATDEQIDSLKRTLQLANTACNWLSDVGWNSKAFNKFALQKLAYHECRAMFSALSSQIIVRCIGKVADAYKIDKKIKREFSLTGAVAYDARVLSFNLDKSIVSIWTVDGRIKIDYVSGDRQKELLLGKRGESDLCYVDGRFYLYVACTVEEPTTRDVKDFIGVDMGIVNIATDSDGESHSGKAVEKARKKYLNRRARLQHKGTKSAKRKLRQIKSKQSRYQKNENHRISKTIVRKANDTGRGIAIEELDGIRERVTVRPTQRGRHSNWSFADLRSKIEYKAKLNGVPVEAVDPRNTSKTCYACGHCEKGNRKTQVHFVCKSCGHAENADVNAARNIRAKAAINRPNVAAMQQGGTSVSVATSPAPLGRGC